MIFAPRSCPSRPGFAITTRIFGPRLRKYMSVKLTVVGCSPAWPNPGGAQSGYLLEGPGRLLLDCGPGVLARLREREAWPHVDAIAITHFHLDHWGDLVPVGLGLDASGPARAASTARALGAARTGARCSRDRRPARAARDVRGGVRAARVRRRRAVHGRRASRSPPLRVLHYELLAFGFRVSANGTVARATPATRGPSDELAELARDADLFVCEATLLAPNPRGRPRGHLAAEEAIAAFEASGAKRLLLTHRPSERPLDEALEHAHDGLEIEL